jgi:hypothetical protein
MQVADANGHADLAKLFQDALSAELGYRVPRLGVTTTVDVSPDEVADVGALLTILRGGKFYAPVLERMAKDQPAGEGAERS